MSDATGLLLCHHSALFNSSTDETKEIQMKGFLMVACMFIASSAFAADCVTNLRGKTICSNGDSAVAVNPNTGSVTSAQKNQNGVTTAQGSNAQKAAYNPNTGNAAVAQTNQNGVTTTRTGRGGEAKTKK